MKRLKKWLGRVGLILILPGILLRNPVVTFREDLPVHATTAQLHRHVQFLTQRETARQSQNTSVLNEVADYIYKEMSVFCDGVEYQTFNVDGQEFRNVICRIEGIELEKIVIGAHYDVAGDQPGADDNASGVAGILELIRLVKSSGVRPQNSLEIAAYALEERPYFRTPVMGSMVHAQSLQESGIPVKFMISVEMIGYFQDGWWSQGYPWTFFYLYYPLKGNFIALIGGLKEYLSIRSVKSQFMSSTGLPIYSLNSPAFVPGVDYSDHLSFWNLGYEAYMLTDTSFYRNPNYHKKTDSIDTLDFSRMAEVVNGLYGIVR